MDEHAAKKKVELDTGAPAAATSDAKQAPKEEPEGENTSFCCAICSTEDIPIETRAVLPCCGTIGSSLQYCRRCIEVIIERGIEGRLGKCPTCNSWLSEKNDQFVTPESRAARCTMCTQEKVIADVGRVRCEACVIGGRYPFQYECNRCHLVQRIPHPMWQYQNTPTEFGGVTWACHRRCGDYTNWRIIPDDAQRVPAELCPQTWGRREEWLQVAPSALAMRCPVLTSRMLLPGIRAEETIPGGRI